MLSKEAIESVTSNALKSVDLDVGEKSQGKVRDIYERSAEHYGGNDEMILVTTDRLSAFDRVLGTVPYKGQILNQISLFWFEQIKDLVSDYVRTSPHPNVIIGEKCDALPIEVIVRGYISGVTKTALWYRYSLGERTIYGHDFPEGLTKNMALPTPIITPTTKGGPTGHDERLDVDEVVSKGYLDAELWDKVQKIALEIFRRGQEVAKEAGLILVDTKYEFGINHSGELVIIDEVHTPDSSRYWRADTYEARIAAGEEPENYDKEFIRLWYAERGYRGDGEPPAFSDELAVFASQRYIDVYEKLTSKTFEPVSYPAENDIAVAVKNS